MIHKLFTDKFVFCCLSEEQRDAVRKAMELHDFKTVYSYQENFTKEKDGYRCNVCGKLHPYLRIWHRDQLIDPSERSKPTGNIYKFKKASNIFRMDHYYAQNKRSLLKFEIDADHNGHVTKDIPIMGEVFHTILSHDETYIATETFKGTIGIIEASTGETIALKKRTQINGAFIFTEDHKLLYYYQESIRCWDYLRNRDTVIWNVPAQWKISEMTKNQIRVVCTNVIFNSKKQSYLFQCKAADKTQIVVIQDNVLSKIVELTRIPSLCKLVYLENLNQYTLTTEDSVVLYDENFNVIEAFTPPQLLKITNGGGFFPISEHISEHPNRAYLSPNRKWILLDYFTSAILMRHEDQKIIFCLFSYTGRVAQHMGFIDNNHFWYTWGDTTYIQEIKD